MTAAVKELGVASLSFMAFEVGLGERGELGLLVMREGRGRSQEK